MDLGDLDEKGLRRLIAKAQKLLAKKEADAEAKFLREMKKAASERGLDFNAVIGRAGSKPSANKPTGRKLGKVAPKYRHPENSMLTWSGRGRTPKWVQEFKDAGTLDSNSSLEPVGHIWTRSAQPWLALPDGPLNCAEQPADMTPFLEAWASR